ncbi:hypothetical protein Tco_0344880 [Tanacetum coccineum]
MFWHTLLKPKKKPVQATKGTKLKSKAKVAKLDKKKKPVKKTKAKGLAVLSEVALTEAKQIKLVTKRSKKEFYVSQASGSGDRVDTQSKVPDEQQQMTSDSEDEDDTDDDDGDNDERTESKSDEIPDLNLTNVDQTEYEEEDVDDRVRTLSDYELTDDENLDDEETMDDEEDDEVIKELYDDVNKVEEDAHLILTPVTEAQKATELVQSSSVSFNFTSKLLNLEYPSPADNEIALLMETLARHTTAIPKITSSFTITVPPPPPFLHPLQQEATPTPTTFTTTTSTNATTTLLEIPNFASVFKFDQKVSAIESELSELKQTNQFAKVVSSISGFVDSYIASKMNEAMDVVVQLQTNKLREEAQAENQEFLNQMAYAVAASLSEFELKKIFIDKMEANKSINISDNQKNLYNALVESYNSDKDIMYSYGDVVLLKRGRDDQDKDKDPSAGSDRGTKRRKSGKDAESPKDSRSKEKKSSSTSKDASQSQHKSSGKSVHAEEPSHTVEDSGMQQDQEFFNDTTFDFSAFFMNWLKIPNLTQEILVGRAFNLLKGTCKSISGLEYHLEECSKATTEYHRGRQIIPKDYFINKDLEYLKGGDLSKRYLTSVTRIKAATYELKWIKDLVPELIIAVTRLTILKMYDYGHLEEIEVYRDDQQLYTFKEGDFKRLPLHMFTIVIQRRVEDLQLGVKSYQKKLNLTKPDTYRSILRNKTTYTLHSDPHGIIYVDQYKRKRLMRANELHRFSDETLNDVRTALHDIAARIRMEYLPMRKWSNLDKKRDRVMVKYIEKQLYQRRLMRNLKMFVGGRIYEKDLRPKMI